MDYPDEMPKYSDLMLPVLQAVDSLGGSGSSREVTDQVLEAEAFCDQLLEVSYESRPNESVLLDRLAWARSSSKLAGALDSPRRGLFQLNDLGREILTLPATEAAERLHDLDRQQRAERRSAMESGEDDEDPESDESPPWRGDLLAQLHRLSPDAFEEFSLYLLRAFGLELQRRGGTGDEGIDGIGRAPKSDVLSTTVAVQAKRYEPTKTLGREVVALFQRDAAAAGAERAIIITTARFSGPARRAATAAAPTVDLIDGERLCDLAEKEAIRLETSLRVDIAWFERFEK